MKKNSIPVSFLTVSLKRKIYSSDTDTATEESAVSSPTATTHSDLLTPSSSTLQNVSVTDTVTEESTVNNPTDTDTLSESDHQKQTIQPVEQNTAIKREIEARQIEINRRRKRARDAQTSQAERMVKRSRVDLKPAGIEDNIAIPIPMVDRGRGDPRNILGIVLDKDEHDLYTIAVKAGVLKNKYTRNEFALCPQRLLTKCDVNTEHKVSLREAMKKVHLVDKDLSVAIVLVLVQKMQF